MSGQPAYDLSETLHPFSDGTWRRPVPVESGSWFDKRIREDEIVKYIEHGKDFIPDHEITDKLRHHRNPDPRHIRDILAKSLAIENLNPDETAALLQVTDPALLEEMKSAAIQVKKKVYDNRIVTFAPLYLGNYCVNNCSYCGFKKDNQDAKRKVLSREEIVKEVEILAGRIGHKRLIVVYGEHPLNDVDYIVDSIRTIYGVQVKVNGRLANIRRVNVNAPPFCIADLKKIHEAGIGTYQVFQETYHRGTYGQVHPRGTIKAHYAWRLYAMHRALEAGIDDVGVGVLFGLHDWKFEVMGLVYHALELEKKFGVGPHTVSFPRLEPALNAPLTGPGRRLVPDEDFMKIILVTRLAIPYAGMILTARERPALRKEAVGLGVTQMDASTKIGIGAYADQAGQDEEKQQFMLQDTRSLDEMIREFAGMGYITSFCTAGYRCGRTGKHIMNLLRSGAEGKFCKLNAVLTFREWLDDFASEETRRACGKLLEQEMKEIETHLPQLYPLFKEYYERITAGERDLCL